MEKKIVVPEVGMGATMLYASDCEPFTIIEVSKSGKRIKIQTDDYMRVDKNGPYTESQEYAYERNIEGPIYDVSLRKDGKWKTVGGNTKVAIGFRRKYTDPCF